MKTIQEVLEEALKQAMAYGFNKGYANDHKPDNDKANIIRDAALRDIAAILEGVGPEDKKQSLPLSPHIAWNQANAQWRSQLKKVLGK